MESHTLASGTTHMKRRIEELIPQRSPILMVDSLDGVEGRTGRASFVVREGSFLVDGNLLTEAGLIEHMAQAALALCSHLCLERGASAPQVGYLGEVKKFRCYRRPRVGEMLRTLVTLGDEIGGIMLVEGVTYVKEELVSETHLKITVGNMFNKE